MGALDPRTGYVGNVWEGFGFVSGPKMGPKIVKHGVTNWTNFGTVFVLIFLLIWGSFLGANLGSDRAKRRQDEPKKGIKSLKVPKTAFTKSEISQCKNHTVQVLEAPKTITRGSRRLPRGT